jgi:hypothetical protein
MLLSAPQLRRHIPLIVAMLSRNSVKSYEAKLAALNALNSALQKENEQLREDLEYAQEPRTESGGADGAEPQVSTVLEPDECNSLRSWQVHKWLSFVNSTCTATAGFGSCPTNCSVRDLPWVLTHAACRGRGSRAQGGVCKEAWRAAAYH